MTLNETKKLLQQVHDAPLPDVEDLRRLLAAELPDQLDEIFAFANNVKNHHHGNKVALRGIIEFANHCASTCLYCGINRYNQKLTRYKMTTDEIMRTAEKIKKARIKTIVLQSGQDHRLDPQWLCRIIKKIKRKYDIAITLSLGEHTREYYKMFKNAGADRYLLRIETTNEKIYKAMHPKMSLQNRIRCLNDLAQLGYQTGSGIIVGLPGQTLETIARDIIFFKKVELDMIGLGPFIPTAQTPLAEHPHGDPELTLKTLALTRIVTKNAHIPATTALEYIPEKKLSQNRQPEQNQIDYRQTALKCGANVIMPNFTPQKYKELYKIYPRTKNTSKPENQISKKEQKQYQNEPERSINMITAANCTVDYSKAHTLKTKNNSKLNSFVLN
jgi:biotin synthase